MREKSEGTHGSEWQLSEKANILGSNSEKQIFISLPHLFVQQDDKGKKKATTRRLSF